jgi:CubicO group peptidase (beta-lactamase class C family)
MQTTKKSNQISKIAVSLLLAVTAPMVGTAAFAGDCCDKPAPKNAAPPSCCAVKDGKKTGDCCDKPKKVAAVSKANPFVPKGTSKATFIEETLKMPPAEQILPGGHDRAFAEMEIVHRAQKEIGSIDVVGWQRARLIGSEKVAVTGSLGATDKAKEFENAWAYLLKRWGVPGATVAVAKDGQLVYSRGFGYADLNTRTKMPPDALFRVASISKALTAVSVLKLVEEGKLSLDTKAMPLLNWKPADGQSVDPELNKVTVGQMLQCTAGWDRRISGDPMFQPQVRQAAYEYSYTMRPTRESITQFWMGKKLDFIPGTHFAYSNFGYSLLGQIIENASKQKYEDYVRNQVLAPLSVTHMRPGQTIELAPGEATYYVFPGQEENVSLLPNFKGKVALPYGGDFMLEAMTPDTGWIASSPELVKFISAVAHDKQSPKIISQQSLDKMLEKPNVPEWKDKPLYFAMGFEADRSLPGRLRFFRQGSLPGVISFVCHRDDGYSYAFCCNSRPQESNIFQTQATALMEMSINQKAFSP